MTAGIATKFAAVRHVAATPRNTTIIGYAMSEGSFQRRLAEIDFHVVGKAHRQSVSRSSRPFFDVLAGNQAWADTFKSVNKDIEFDSSQFGGSKVCGIIVPDGAASREAFAIQLPCERRIVPAVLLRVTGAKWDATACVLDNSCLAELVSLRSLSASVMALLTMTEKAFAVLLGDQQKEQARFEYLRSAGEQFLPVMPDKDNWEIACTWPDWQWRRRDYIERTDEWAQTHRIPVNTAKELDRLAAYLRQRWRRLGLHIGDTTDV